MPLLFASFFACVMVVYGISRLFAATSVRFTLTPTPQTGTAGQVKTYTIRMDPNDNYIRGGVVRVSYDSNYLTYNKATLPASTAPYTVSPGSVSNGVFSLSFSTNASKAAANLMILEFTVKSVPTTANTNISFVAANTYAYLSSSRVYASTYGNAVMSVQAPVAAKPAVSVALNPASVAYNGATTVTWSATGNPSSCTNNFGGAQAASGSLRVTGLTSGRTFTVTCANAGGSGADSKTVSVGAKPGEPPVVIIDPIDIGADLPPSGGGSDFFTGGYTNLDGDVPAGDVLTPVLEPNGEGLLGDFSGEEGGLPTDGVSAGPESKGAGKKSSPIAAIAAMIVGVGVLGGSAYLYFVRLRPGSRLPAAAAEDLSTGLFDDTTEETARAALGLAPLPPEPEQPPQSEQPYQTPDQVPVETPYQTEEPPEGEVEVHISHDEMTEEAFNEPPESVELPEAVSNDNDWPVEEATNDAGIEISHINVPPLSPADRVAQATLASLAAQKPKSRDDLTKQAAASMPKPPEPGWQKSVTKKKLPKEEPKDMFELAQEDPENFGSTQLAESYGEEIDNNHHETIKKHR